MVDDANNRIFPVGGFIPLHGTRQQATSVRASSEAPTEVGEMTVMGHLKQRVILTPDWEMLFNEREKELLDKSSDSSDEEEEDVEMEQVKVKEEKKGEKTKKKKS